MSSIGVSLEDFFPGLSCQRSGNLLHDWGRWQTPSLAAQVDAIKLALPEVWQDGDVWRWSYCLPNGELLELKPVQL